MSKTTDERRVAAALRFDLSYTRTSRYSEEECEQLQGVETKGPAKGESIEGTSKRKEHMIEQQ